MKIGDQVEGGIYASSVNGHHIICSPIEYNLPFRVNWHQAIDYCKAIGMVPPSKAELNLLYELYKSNLEYFPKRDYHWYWSFTESSSTYAWSQDFNFGNQCPNNKTLNGYVRSIKRVKI